jgi:hypothetical protein
MIKKIGVLTYIKEYSNLGTNMQSYCTLKAIQKAYPDARVEIINYSAWKPSRKPYLSNISLHSLKNDFIRMNKYNRFFDEQLTFSKTQLVSSNIFESIEFVRKQNYDAIYVGSDTVLELRGANKDELTVYWLDKTIDCKKYLLAASSLNVVYDALSEKQKSKIQETIDGFSLLGVRDDATYRLLSFFTSKADKRLQIIPDPTFTYEIDYGYIEQYIKKRKLIFKKPLVCLHLTRDTKWGSDLSRYFKQEGFIIASLRPAYYADIIFTDLSPFEQIGIYKYFSLVITHRFHDAIFCLKNYTPVIVYPENVTDITSYGENKNLTLLKSFHVDKTNYIENKYRVSARDVIDIYPEAIRNIKNNREFIKATLINLKEKYESFINESKRINAGISS